MDAATSIKATVINRRSSIRRHYNHHGSGWLRKLVCLQHDTDPIIIDGNGFDRPKSGLSYVKRLPQRPKDFDGERSRHSPAMISSQRMEK